MSITGNIIFSNTPDPSVATLLVVDVHGGLGLGQTYRADGSVAAQPLSSRKINFNSTTVGQDEAGQIAQWAMWFIATGGTGTKTAPVSGITVTGNGVGAGVTVATISLSQALAQQFAEAVGVWASTTP